jgi:rod shape-determining protein MreC
LAAIAIMIADHRFQALGSVRLGVSAVLNPIERVVAMPAAVISSGASYFTNQQELLTDNAALKAQLLQSAQSIQQANLLMVEHQKLLALANTKPRFNDQAIMAEIIRDARNASARKVIINRGLSTGVSAGLAVIDGTGVVGQITQANTMSSEVTLLTEKDHAVPVMVLRNGLRTIAVGAGRDGLLDVQFIPSGGDVQVGDELVTSGIDGTYPAGLKVASIISVDRKAAATAFSKIYALPYAASNAHRFVSVLKFIERHDYPKPEVPLEEKKSGKDKTDKPTRRGGR